MQKKLLLKRCCNFQQTNWRTIFASKSFYVQNEETIERIKKEIEESKKKLKWRPEVGDRPGDWNSKFKVFADKEQNSDLLTLMQQPIDLRPSAIKKWWDKRSENFERHMQSFIPDRNKILGSDLAAANFIVYRGGAVRFVNQPKWVKSDECNEYSLPNKYDESYKLEAVRCDNMTLYYEGLENFRNLQHLKFLSFHNVKEFDDFCLDRVSGLQNPLLEVLDISGTNITYRGLSALYRLQKLKLLIVDDPKCSKEFELSCSMLQTNNVKLKICSSGEIHDL